MNYSEYDEVINGEKTYKEIAKLLKEDKAVGIGWTDEIYTHFDIIFKLGLSNKSGIFQRGIKQDYLFVSIIDYTSYGFRADTIKDVGYIQEKLRMNNETGEKLAELINGIIKEMNGEN